MQKKFIIMYIMKICLQKKCQIYSFSYFLKKERKKIDDLHSKRIKKSPRSTYVNQFFRKIIFLIYDFNIFSDKSPHDAIQ